MIAAANIPFIVVSIRPTVSSAIAEQQMAQLWREPDNIATADLFAGPWPDDAPDPMPRARSSKRNCTAQAPA